MLSKQHGDTDIIAGNHVAPSRRKPVVLCLARRALLKVPLDRGCEYTFSRQGDFERSPSQRCKTLPLIFLENLRCLFRKHLPFSFANKEGAPPASKAQASEPTPAPSLGDICCFSPSLLTTLTCSQAHREDVRVMSTPTDCDHQSEDSL